MSDTLFPSLLPVDDILATVATIEDNHPLTNDALINDVIMETIHSQTGVRLNWLHCQKTGKPIAQMAPDVVADLIYFHGVKGLTDIADKLTLATCIHPNWVVLSPELLDLHQEKSPYEFFTYSINLLLRNMHQKYTSKGTKIWMDTDVQRLFQNSLVDAWYSIQAFPLDRLRNINKLLRHCLFLNLHNTMRHTIRWDTVGQSQPSAIEDTRSNRKQFRQMLHNEALTKNRDLNQYLSKWQRQIKRVMPHEMATDAGLRWIETYLESIIKQTYQAMQQTEADHSNMRVNSLFGRGSNVLSLDAMIDYNLRDLNMSVVTIVDRQTVIQKAKQYKKDEYVTKETVNAKVVKVEAPKQGVNWLALVTQQKKG